MSAAAQCGARIRACARAITTEVRQCAETRDEGHNECVQQRDEGYRDCCDWIPCSWACKAWVWVAHIVCVVWEWISWIVCVAWTLVKRVACLFWVVTTFPLCLLWPKLAEILDGILRTIVDIVETILKTVLSIIRGVLYALLHPVQLIDTIINLFRGCPDVRSDAATADGYAMYVIAHHGYPAIWPENTTTSCEAALRRGADALEIDLCLTADGTVVLWHDWDPDEVTALARQAGEPTGFAYYPDAPPIGSEWRRPVDQLTLAELRAHYGYQNREDPAVKAANDITYGPRDTRIPTLEEFLAEARTWQRLRKLFLDIKMPGTAVDSAEMMIDRIHAALQGSHHSWPQVVLMVPRYAVLEAMKARSDEQGYGLAFTWDVEFPAGIVFNPIRYSAIDHAVTPFHNSVASVGRPTTATLFPWKTYRRTIEYDIGRWNQVNAAPSAQNSGVHIDLLIAWTVDEEDELRCLVDMGVSGIITNHTDVLARILGRPTL
jgi:glycerophosphoryl diester phosphodiesterase